MKHILSLAILTAGLTIGVEAQTNLVPLSWDWSRAHESAIDPSRFLDAPAGKGGYRGVRRMGACKANTSSSPTVRLCACGA
jgi:hypothetical protein